MRISYLYANDLGLWRYAYDRQGRLVRQEDAGGNVTCLYYDSVERLTDKRFLGNAAACPGAAPVEGTAQSISYHYSSGGSARGQVVESARFGEGGVTWYVQTRSYDALGRLAGTAVKLSPELAVVGTSYGYDAWHRPSTVTYFGGEVLTTTYNGMGLSAHLTRTVGVTSEALVSGSAIGGNGQADGVEYDAQGRVVKMQLPAGADDFWRTQSYGGFGAAPDNNSGLLTNIEVKKENALTASLTLTSTYDSFGNLKTLTEGATVSSFSYDDQSKLTSAFGRSFGYTAAGSFSSFEGKAATYGSFPLHGLNTLGGASVYEYDASGRVVERNVGGVSRTLGWTGAGELRSVSVGGVTQESYRYDPEGERIVQARAGGAATYRFSPHYEVSLDDGAASATRSYFFNGVRVAQKVDDGALTYLHTDHLGSTVLTTGVSGSKKYHAYGGTRGGSVPSEWQYTGQELDGGTGLVYMHARYYDPATGQFLSPDTLVPEPGNVLAYNRYMYSYGNPLRFSDATGHCATLEDGSPNLEGDENSTCWQLAFTIFGAWNSPFTTVSDDWKVSPDVWLKNIASAFYADAEYLRPHAERYTQQHLSGSGVQKDPVIWNEPPPHFDASDRLELLRLFEGAGVCGVWDCTAVWIDTATIGTQLFRDTSLFSTPVTGPLGMSGATYGGVLQSTLTVADGLHTIQQYSNGDATNADLAAAAAFTGLEFVPVVGEFSSGAQLLWDLTDPLVPW